MKAMSLLIALAMGAAQAGGMETRMRARSAPIKKAVDLDLNMDLAEDAPVPAAPAAPAPEAKASRAWMYWTAAGATLAAGGVGWYIHENMAKQPATIRNEQVFTDDR
jgi:hypothetical protein